jgi:hypothetical protein
MTGRLEAAHRPLVLARWLVRVLRAIVDPPVAAMLNARHDLVLCSLIATEFVSY